MNDNNLSFTLLSVLFVLLQLIAKISAQSLINLGTFSLNRNPNDGQMEVGFGQGGNIFGFGANRDLKISAGEQGFNAQSSSGASVGSEQFGSSGSLSVVKDRGLTFGSGVQLGNSPTIPSFVDSLQHFFKNFIGLPSPSSESATIVSSSN